MTPMRLYRIRTFRGVAILVGGMAAMALGTRLLGGWFFVGLMGAVVLAVVGGLGWFVVHAVRQWHRPTTFGDGAPSSPPLLSALTESEWRIVEGNPQLAVAEGRRCPQCGRAVQGLRGAALPDAFEVLFSCDGCRWNASGLARF